MLSRNSLYVLLFLTLGSPIACRTRLADDLDGFVCDTATGICTPKGDGSQIDEVPASSSDGSVQDTSSDERGGGGEAATDASTPEDADDAGVDGIDAAMEEPGSVYIASPIGTVYTNGSVLITIGFAGPMAPATVEILSNASTTPLASIGAPFSFMWNTTNNPEGTYDITARARFGSNVATSTSVTIIIDRTPPTIVTKLPVASAMDVDLTVPSVITVSEPLLPATVSSSTVQLTVAGSVVPSKSVLSADGRTVTVTVSDRHTLLLPSTIREVLPGTITDLAGNALAPTSWTWTAPLWIQYGGINGGSPDLTFDSKGNVLLTTIAERGAIGSRDFEVLVGRHSAGTTWDTSFGSPQGPQISSLVGGPSAIASAPDDNPIIAWPELEDPNSGTPADIHVAKWNGTSWDRSFGQLGAEQGSGTDAGYPRLVATATGQFYVAWAESSQKYVTSIYAARWTGTSWDLGYGGIAKIGAQQPTLRVGPDGQPVLTWTSSLDGAGLSRWTGSAWASTTFPNFGLVGLAFDSMQRPLVTSTSISASTPSISVYRYDASLDMVLASAPQVLTGSSPSGARLAVDDQGRILLAWSDSDGSTRNVHLFRLEGNIWDVSFGTISAVDGANTPADNPILVVTPEGAPVVAWEEKDSVPGARPTTFVWKSNH